MRGPWTRRVSTKPCSGSNRGGASGNSTWITRPAEVTARNHARTRAHASGWRRTTHAMNPKLAVKWTNT